MMTPTLRLIPKFFVGMALCATLLSAQAQKPVPKPAVKTAAAAPDISGMYTFLEEGEFVQINVENAAEAAPAGKFLSQPSAPTPAKGNVSGFVSRFGDLESDKGAFLDHFFTKGALAGSVLSFSTRTVHGVWFEFTGKVERGPGKLKADEGFYVIRGTLKRNQIDANKQTMTQSREVILKSFPDIDTAEPNPGN
ncbi:MAG: hypothetical protein ABIP12_02595 [Terriglobales bacterium]